MSPKLTLRTALLQAIQPWHSAPGASTASQKSDRGFFPGNLLLKCVLDNLLPFKQFFFFPITSLQLLISAGRTNIRLEAHLQ